MFYIFYFTYFLPLLIIIHVPLSSPARTPWGYAYHYLGHQWYRDIKGQLHLLVITLHDKSSLRFFFKIFFVPAK